MTQEQETQLLRLLEAMQNKQIDLGKVAVRPRGIYSDQTEYEGLDLVKHSNSAYLSLADGNVGNPVSDQTKWLCIINGEDAVRNAALALAAANDANTAAGNATTAAERANDARVLIMSVLDEAETTIQECEGVIDQAREVIAAASEVEGLGLIPTGLEVSYPAHITLGNKSELRIGAKLTPSIVQQNIIFIADNDAVSVGHDGTIHVNKVGKSIVHIIPTMKTAIARSVMIEVVMPSIRKVTASSMRLDSSGNIRLN